jgi:hypothetical protein
MSARFIHQPQPGFYKMHLVSGGPWVGVRIWRDDAGQLCAEAHGEPCDPDEVWPFTWPSDEVEFAYYDRLRVWAQQHDVDHPAAEPRKRINLRKMPPRI